MILLCGGKAPPFVPVSALQLVLRLLVAWTLDFNSFPLRLLKVSIMNK